MEVAVRRLAALLPLTLLTACFDFDCEEVIATVTWDPAASVFHVDLVLANVGVSTFDCQGVESCVDAVRHALQPLPDGPLPDEGQGFWPAVSLAHDGATGIDVGLERRGDEVDLRLKFSGVPNGDATEVTDVYVLDEGKPGKTRSRLLVVLPEGGTIEPATGKPYVFRAPEDDGDEVTNLWLLPRKARTVTARRPSNPDVQPMLAAVPGLEPKLVEAGLLPP